MDLTGTETFLFFGRKRNIFVWEEHSLGVTNVCDHPCLTSQTPCPPNNASMLKRLPETLVRLAYRKLKL